MRLKQFTQVSQKELFKLREEDELVITPKTQKLIEVLEAVCKPQIYSKRRNKIAIMEI